MAAHAARFDELVEMIDYLPLDQRESLVDVVCKRMAEEPRCGYTPLRLRR